MRLPIKYRRKYLGFRRRYKLNGVIVPTMLFFATLGLLFLTIGAIGETSKTIQTYFAKDKSEGLSTTSKNSEETKKEKTPVSTKSKPSPTPVKKPSVIVSALEKIQERIGEIIPGDEAKRAIVNNERHEPKIEPLKPDPIPVAEKVEIGGLNPQTDQQLSFQKGSLSFEFKPDWGEEQKVLLLGNYNGIDTKNLFKVTASSQRLDFTVYGKDGEDNSSAGEFDGISDTYAVKIEWNFEGLSETKVYVNNVLMQTNIGSYIPTQKQDSFYIGPISNLVVE